MQRLGQLLDHVAGFMNMNLAALKRRVGAEGATDDFAYRLGAVDDEQPADLGIKPALSGGAHPRRFCRSLDSRAARLSCHGSPSVSLNFGIPEVASILLAKRSSHGPRAFVGIAVAAIARRARAASSNASMRTL
jgi:hypothetical protein